jgi:predicted ABC-type ATPase
MNGLSFASVDLIHRQFLDNRPRSDAPVLCAMAGIPGAGKSTFVNHALETGRFPRDAFILDPDRVMQALPEYQASFQHDGAEAAFARWEMPARELAYAMLDKAVQGRMNIIKDMGCARMENFEKLRAIKSAGYRLEMFYIPCPIETALARITTRPRHTPKEMIIERAAALKALIPLYQTLADDFHVVDNGL